MKKIRRVIILGDDTWFTEKRREWILNVYKEHLLWETGTSYQQSCFTFRRMVERKKENWAQLYLSVFLVWTHLRQKIVVYCNVLLPGGKVRTWIKNDFFVLWKTMVWPMDIPQWLTMDLLLAIWKPGKQERIITPLLTGPQNSSEHVRGLALRPTVPFGCTFWKT